MKGFGSKGFRELDRSLARLERGIPADEQRAALRAGAQVIADEARRLAPVLSGRLRDSIRVVDAGAVGADVAAGENGLAVFIGPVGSTDEGDVYYARFQEEGTSTMRAHPFMRPAAFTKRGEAARITSRLLAADVEKLTK